jgi:hypothetical protein
MSSRRIKKTKARPDLAHDAMTRHDELNAQDEQELPKGQMRVNSKKVFLSSSEGPPIFINAAEFAANGIEVYMDVGVVSVESVNRASQAFQMDPTVIPDIDLQVSHRFAFSMQAAALIHQRLTAMLQESAKTLNVAKSPELEGQ